VTIIVYRVLYAQRKTYIYNTLHTSNVNKFNNQPYQPQSLLLIDIAYSLLNSFPILCHLHQHSTV